MSFSSAIGDFFKGLSNKDPNKESIEHGFLGSSRFLIVAVVLGALGYLAITNIREMLTNPVLLICVFSSGTLVILAYLFCNSSTKKAQIQANAQIISERQRLAWADGVLSDAEAAALKSADDSAKTVASAVASAVAPPA